jgi:hypothetical protein
LVTGKEEVRPSPAHACCKTENVLFHRVLIAIGLTSIAVFAGCRGKTPDPDQLPLASGVYVEQHATRPGATDYLEILVLRGSPGESAQEAVGRQMAGFRDEGWTLEYHRKQYWWGAKSPDADVFATVSAHGACLKTKAGSVDASDAPAFCGSLSY